VVYWNYLSNTLKIKGNTITSLNIEYDNLFTPAGYAFSIWGIIYSGLFALSIYQIKKVFFDKKEDDFVSTIGLPLNVAILGSGAWLWFWLNEQTGISVLVMLMILVSLLSIIVNLNMKKWTAVDSISTWVWLPISLFSSWISVATIANISAYLVKIGWAAGVNEIMWTVIMIVVAVAVNLAMIYLRNLRAFAAIGIWALIGIAVKHWDNIPTIQWAAMIGAAVLFVAIIVHVFKSRKIA
ncbi:MAG: hypothetical protein ACI9XO_004459, partial [Paraglaciecola sp.]